MNVQKHFVMLCFFFLPLRRFGCRDLKRRREVSVSGRTPPFVSLLTVDVSVAVHDSFFYSPGEPNLTHLHTRKKNTFWHLSPKKDLSALLACLFHEGRFGFYKVQGSFSYFHGQISRFLTWLLKNTFSNH
jgi:hypothetical protein